MGVPCGSKRQACRVCVRWACEGWHSLWQPHGSLAVRDTLTGVSLALGRKRAMRVQAGRRSWRAACMGETIDQGSLGPTTLPYSPTEGQL